jgi:ABC-type transporter MlaC component
MLCLGESQAFASSCPQEAFVLNVGRVFSSVAATHSPTAFLRATNRFSNTHAIAATALGPYRNKLGSRESEYYQLADQYIGKFMARYASGLTATGMKVQTCQGNQVTATTASGSRIVFRVSGSNGHYSMSDVSVSGIWLVGQMRATFTGIIRRNNDDINALLSFLRGY